MRPILSSRGSLPLLAIWLGVVSCATLEPGPLPEGAVPLTAPPAYAEWFERTEACAGLSGDFTGIEWYVVPDVTTFETELGDKVGLWEQTGGVTRITIAGAYTEHEMVVRHEMLHELLGREGHPQEYFVTRCQLTWDSWASTEQ
jgi:hypothetical protein